MILGEYFRGVTERRQWNGWEIAGNWKTKQSRTAYLYCCGYAKPQKGNCERERLFVRNTNFLLCFLVRVFWWIFPIWEVKLKQKYLWRIHAICGCSFRRGSYKNSDMGLSFESTEKNISNECCWWEVWTGSNPEYCHRARHSRGSRKCQTASWHPLYRLANHGVYLISISCLLLQPTVFKQWENAKQADPFALINTHSANILVGRKWGGVEKRSSKRRDRRRLFSFDMRESIWWEADCTFSTRGRLIKWLQGRLNRKSVKKLFPFGLRFWNLHVW